MISVISSLKIKPTLCNAWNHRGLGLYGKLSYPGFLNNGFEVKVSATDIAKEEKYKHLMELPHADQLHISELNVENKAALKSFVYDCDIVIHGG